MHLLLFPYLSPSISTNCLDVINWADHLRVIKVIKFTKSIEVQVKENHSGNIFENKVTSFR